MNFLKKVLLNEKFQIEDGSGNLISLLKYYFINFEDFEGKSKYCFKIDYRTKKFFLYHGAQKIFSHTNPFFIINFLDFFLKENIFPLIEDFLILHASSISEGKNSVLISGRAGSGKSTLCLLLSKKFFYMSDDIVPVVYENNEILSGGYPQPIAIYRDLKSLIKDEKIMESSGVEKIFVFPQNIFKNRFLPLKCIIFPVPSRFNKIEALKKSRAFLYLSSVSLNSCDFIKTKGLDLIREIVYRVPVFKIFWNSFDFLIKGTYEIFKKTSFFT